MINSLPPGMVLILGALIIPWLPGRGRSAVTLLLPILSALHLLSLASEGPDTRFVLEFFGYELTPTHIDRLSLVWGYVFHIAAFISALYSLRVKDSVQQVSGLIYIGAAIGAIFAGDLITLFVCWEMTAISSVFLIWASRTERSYRAGMRYLIFQVGSGVLLLSGILFHFRDTGSLAFDSAFRELLPAQEGYFAGLNSPGTVLIFIAFGIKAAFPLLHNWLTDAYPEATPTGTVVLSAFTTKLAIYALARGFPGTEILIYIGAVMAAFPLFYAAIENDLRRVLAYALNNQLGFMVVGVGVGTSLALDGVAAHAFVHILYKSLLFMSMGAVLVQTGTTKASELGGLYKSMPWTTAFCIIGGAAMSFPLFGGFVSKSLILTAAAEEHHTAAWLVLLFASAGVFLTAGIKVTYFAFFAQDSGKRVQEAPLNMLIAMGIAAALCILIGILPGPLYSILPYQDVVVEHHTISILDHHIYTPTHVITQLQLLLWSGLAFTVLNRLKFRGAGIYPRELPSENLNTDWFYRRPFMRGKGQKLSPVEKIHAWAARVRGWADAGVASLLRRLNQRLSQLLGPDGVVSRTWSVSAKVACAALLLTGYLVVYYIYL